MSKIKVEGNEEKPLSSSDEDDDSSREETKSKCTKTTQVLKNETNINNENNNTGIIEVYKENLNQEMKNLISLLNEYNYIGMDTEFPGIVYSLPSVEEDFYYKSLKINTESLKLIQLGITLSNSKGENPKPYHTWQFNFEFDY